MESILLGAYVNTESGIAATVTYGPAPVTVWCYSSNARAHRPRFGVGMQHIVNVTDTDADKQYDASLGFADEAGAMHYASICAGEGASELLF